MAKKRINFPAVLLGIKIGGGPVVNEEHMSIREVAKGLDIQNKSQVQVWAAKTKHGMSLEPGTSKRGRPKNEVSQYEIRGCLLVSGD